MAARHVQQMWVQHVLHDCHEIVMNSLQSRGCIVVQQYRAICSLAHRRDEMPAAAIQAAQLALSFGGLRGVRLQRPRLGCFLSRASDPRARRCPSPARQLLPRLAAAHRPRMWPAGIRHFAACVTGLVAVQAGPYCCFTVRPSHTRSCHIFCTESPAPPPSLAASARRTNPCMPWVAW